MSILILHSLPLATFQTNEYKGFKGNLTADGIL